MGYKKYIGLEINGWRVVDSRVTTRHLMRIHRTFKLVQNDFIMFLSDRELRLLVKGRKESLK